MKATGIVRRIDDLGRVVIPKEITDNVGTVGAVLRWGAGAGETDGVWYIRAKTRQKNHTIFLTSF